LKNILPFDGELYLVERFYPKNEANHLFDLLLERLAWQQEKIFLYGRWVKVPRLMCWYGDMNAEYRYSGVNHQPMAWIEELVSVKKKLKPFIPVLLTA